MKARDQNDLVDSGVVWIGAISQHWVLKPLKHVASFQNGCAFKPTEWSDDGIPIIRIENLNGGNDFNYFNGTVDPRFHVYDGSLLFGWSGNRGTSFGPFWWRRRGLHYLNQHIFKVSSQSEHQAWLYWALRAVTFYVEEEAHGIIGMVHVTKGRLGAIPIPVPSLAEQHAIAAFLDRETARIDRLISKKRQLIELLREKRQAVISQAVTKGLDPKVPMKDSGIEWLGHTPAHWQACRTKFVAGLYSGHTPSRDKPEY